MNKNIAKTKEWREVRAFIESGRKEWQKGGTVRFGP